MLDWVTATVPFSHPDAITGGKILKLLPPERPDDPPVVEWEVNSRLVLEGSWSQKMTVRTTQHGFLEISGNPAKYFQGHNVFGTDDLRFLVYRFMMLLCQLRGVEPDPFDEAAWMAGRYQLSRIDFNQMIAFRDRSEVRTAIRALQDVAIPYRGRATNKDGTLYWGMAQGKKAKPWQIKMYCKADEMNLKDVPLNLEDRGSDEVDWGGHLPKGMRFRSRLCEWADNKLRVELTLRRKELLKMGIEDATMLTPSFLCEIFAVYVGRLKIGDTVAYTVDDVERLPRSLRTSWNLWKMGYDLRQQLPKVTFYRHKKEIFERLGVDIAVVQPKDARIIPLRQVIAVNFTPAPLPDWASSAGLMFQPSKHEIERARELGVAA